MMSGQTVSTKRKNLYGGEETTGLYCRLSRDDDQVGDSNSIIHQKEMLMAYAKEKRLKNPTFYVDDGVSGTTFNRPDFQRMMADVGNGRVTTIVVKDMSRFGRDHIMVGYYTKYILPEHGVRFIAINDQVDSASDREDDITPFRNILNKCTQKIVRGKSARCCPQKANRENI